MPAKETAFPAYVRLDAKKVSFDRGWTTALERRLLLGFVLLGLLARCVRYFLNFPLWEDESFLCYNFIHRDYWQILQPLDFLQVAPPLFLWIELTLVGLFDFSEPVLRLFPFLCSLASLLLFAHLAQRLLRGPALVLAVAVFAVSYAGIRYAGEAKQYASDLLAALVLLTLVVEWVRQPQRHRWLSFLCLVTPILLWLSFPLLFLAGGISLVLAGHLWRQQKQHGWRTWAIYNVLLAGSFLLLIQTQQQSPETVAFMQRFWGPVAFPPASLLDWPRWLLLVHSGEMLAYPIGGENGASFLTLLICLIGVVALFRQRQRLLLVLLTAPFSLNFLAALLRRYPYGGAVKFSIYGMPLICLLMGVGLATLLGGLAQRWPRPRWHFATVVVLAVIGMLTVARDLAKPYKQISDMRARAFAQWFWFSAGFDGEVACVKNDLGVDFAPQSRHELNWAAMYYCNQRIWSPRQRRPLQLERVSVDHPLRCVLFRDEKHPGKSEDIRRWLEEMEKHYELLSQQRYAYPRTTRDDRAAHRRDHIEVYTFVPRLVSAR